MENLPKSRSDWAKLDWKNAQHSVGRLMNYNGFMKLEEKRVALGSRADLIIIQNHPKRAIIGIIEVKCYNRVTPKLQKTAKLQACRYLSHLYNSNNQNARWNKKLISYFIVTVFTKDYPVKDVKLSKKDRRQYLPEELIDVPILSSTPESLLNILTKNNLMMKKNDNLKKFFNSE